MNSHFATTATTMPAVTIAVLLNVLAAAAAAAEGAGRAPAEAATGAAGAAERHATFDPAPDLQRTPGGNLIVNAFLMRGPVRVAIRDRDSDRLLLERREDTLFPFELSHRELGVEPDQVIVDIYIDGALEYQLTLQD